MAAFSTIIAGVGIAAAVAGSAVSVNASNQATAASKRAEALRERQMQLEAARSRRQVVRNMLRARSAALVGATAQGASGGSGLAGGYGQIGQQSGENMTGINQGTEIGAGIFSANRDYANAQSLVSFGQGLSSLGGTLMNNSGTIGRVGSYMSGGAIQN